MRMIHRVAFEGIDGSGKTTVANHLADLLQQEGISAVVRSPFRMANEQLGQEVYSLWKTRAGAKAGVVALKNAVEICENEAADSGTEVLLYDRHWMTLLSEIQQWPSLIELWGDNYVPAALLRAHPAEATRRAKNDTGSQWTNLIAQTEYDQTFRELAAANPQHMLGIYRTDVGVSTETIAKTINWDMHIQR